MDLDGIREELRNDRFNLTLHATEERLRKNLTTDQILEAVMKGTVAKVEDDERTGGKLKKFTLDWRNFRVVVKNDQPPLIISVRVK